MKGIIVLWGGAIVDIPAGWALCDGLNGRPDLRDRFVIGAGTSFSPDDTAPTNLTTDSGLAYYALAYIIKV